MSIIKTTLLRERFEIFTSEENVTLGKPIPAVSNRMVIGLGSPDSPVYEEIIVRTQTMHSCVRLAARIFQEYKNKGPILNRHVPLDWESIWDKIINDYDYVYNPERWAAIYCHGKALYKAGKPHPFLDVIEKCDYTNDGIYDEAVFVAEEAFRKTGKTVHIDYIGNIALIVDLDKMHGRMGIILRGASRTTTFSMTLDGIDKQRINTSQSLASAAAFLEGIQIAYRLGRDLEPVVKKDPQADHRLEMQMKRARERLYRLEEEIGIFENAHNIRYRPEKPDFFIVAREAEEMAKRRAKKAAAHTVNDFEDDLF